VCQGKRITPTESSSRRGLARNFLIWGPGRRRTAPLPPPMEKLAATGIRGIRNGTTDGLTASEAPRPQGKIPGHASGEQNVSKGNFILIVPLPACG